MLSVLLPASDPALDTLCQKAVMVAREAEQGDFGVAVGVPDRVAGTVRWGGFNAEKTRYPASTIKLFWLAFAHRQLADGKLKTSPELERAMRDMIVDSVNDATAQVVDATTETTGGPELAPKALKAWMDRRQAANRWFASLGYTGINACQKTWNEGPYGRERQGYGPNMELRNAMAPLAGMRLLSEVMMDRIVDPKACAAMRDLLHRTRKDDEQLTGFAGQVAVGEVWSKAGWTSTTRHDLAWIKAPDGREVVLAIFTENHAKDETLLPRIARELLTGLGMPVKPA